MKSYQKKESNDNQYYIFTDYYRTKDLIWDAYYGFVNHYNNYRMYNYLGRTKGPFMGGMVKYAVFMFEEIDDFLDKIYTEPESKLTLERLRKLFSSPKVRFTDQEILFLRKFFGRFMVDSGVKDIAQLRDNRNPIQMMYESRYPDLVKKDDDEDS